MTAPGAMWAPEEIYLTEVDFEDPDYPLVWASISADSGGERYVRADLMDARIAELDAANARLFGALDAIRQYCNDTFSGPSSGPLDAEWYREAVIVSRNRARNAMAGRHWTDDGEGL